MSSNTTFPVNLMNPTRCADYKMFAWTLETFDTLTLQKCHTCSRRFYDLFNAGGVKRSSTASCCHEPKFSFLRSHYACYSHTIQCWACGQ